MSKGGYKIIDQGGMQSKRLLLWKEMWAAKNRTFDIDLLFVSPELQTQDSATLRLEATKDSWGKMIIFVSSISTLNKMTLLILCYGDQKGIPEN